MERLEVVEVDLPRCAESTADQGQFGRERKREEREKVMSCAGWGFGPIRVSATTQGEKTQSFTDLREIL